MQEVELLDQNFNNNNCRMVVYTPCKNCSRPCNNCEMKYRIIAMQQTKEIFSKTEY